MPPMSRAERFFTDLPDNLQKAGIVGAGIVGAGLGAAGIGLYNLASLVGDPLLGSWADVNRPKSGIPAAPGGTTSGTSSGAVLSGSAPATASALATTPAGSTPDPPAPAPATGGTVTTDPVVIDQPFTAEHFEGIEVEHEGQRVTLDAPQAERVARAGNTLMQQRRGKRRLRSGAGSRFAGFPFSMSAAEFRAILHLSIEEGLRAAGVP
jgi:hypothetical protein